MKESAHVWFLDVVHEALWKALDAAGMKCHDGTGVSLTPSLRVTLVLAMGWS